MAQITQYFDDLRDLTYTVTTAAVTGGKFVEADPSGDRRCRPAGAASTTIVGVAAYDAPVGSKVKVIRMQMVPMNSPAASIAAGVAVTSDANGDAVVMGAAGFAAKAGRTVESRANAGTVRVVVD